MDKGKWIQGPGLSYDRALHVQDAAAAHRFIDSELQCPYCKAAGSLNADAKALVAVRGSVYDIYTVLCEACTGPPFQVYVDVTDRGLAEVGRECLAMAKKQGDENAVITLSQMTLPRRR